MKIPFEDLKSIPDAEEQDLIIGVLQRLAVDIREKSLMGRKLLSAHKKAPHQFPIEAYKGTRLLVESLKRKVTVLKRQLKKINKGEIALVGLTSTVYTISKEPTDAEKNTIVKKELAYCKKYNDKYHELLVRILEDYLGGGIKRDSSAELSVELNSKTGVWMLTL